MEQMVVSSEPRTRQSNCGTDARARIKTIFVALTRQCNLRCRHCSFDAIPRRTEGVLAWGTFCNLVDDARAIGADHIVLSGGEPLMHPNITDMAALVLQRGLDISISTNGFIRRHDLEKILADHASNSAVQVSIDGDELTHDALRGKKGSFGHAIATLKALRSEGIQVSAAFTVCDENYWSLPDVLATLSAMGVPLRIGLLYPIGRGKSLRGVDIDRVFKLVDFVKTARSFGATVETNLPATVDPDGLKRIGERVACGWGRDLVGVHPDGSVWLCVNTPPQVAAYGGSLVQHRLQEILLDSTRGVARARTLKTSELKGACAICGVRDLCGGACRTLALEFYGDLLAPFPLCQQLYERQAISPREIRPA